MTLLVKVSTTFNAEGAVIQSHDPAGISSGVRIKRGESWDRPSVVVHEADGGEQAGGSVVPKACARDGFDQV